MTQQPSSREATHKASKAPQKDEREQRIEWLATRNAYFVLVAGLLLGALYVLLRSGYAIPLLSIATITSVSLLFLLVQWLRLTRMKAPDERASQLMLKSFRLALLLSFLGFLIFYFLDGIILDRSQPISEWLNTIFLGHAVYYATLLTKNCTAQQTSYKALFWLAATAIIFFSLLEIPWNLAIEGLGTLFGPNLIFLAAAAYLCFIVLRHDRRTVKESSDE